MTHAEQDETDENPKHQNQDLTRKCSPSARSIKSVSPDGLGKESAIKTQLGLIKQTTGKDVKVEAVIDFTLLRQVLGKQNEQRHRDQVVMKSKHDPKRIPGEKHFLTGIAIKLDVGLQDLTPHNL